MTVRRLSWERDGRDWPHREASRFVNAAGIRWHVQVMGSGPAVLLVHGTGASTHSFRAVASLLAPRFTVVAPDLPGHGFTGAPLTPSGYSLPVVARGLAALMTALGVRPVLAVGHSAGAAVVLRMTLDGLLTPAAVISLNGALLPFAGVASELFGPVARFLASSSITAQAFSWFAGSNPSVERMIRSTGSRIDAEGMRLYERLAGNPGHVQGALGLMANWDLRPLVRDLPRLPVPLVLVTGSQDGMVPPSQSYRVRSLAPKTELVSLRGLGHLAHEEQPAEIAALLQRMVPHETSG
jgi:magnesium chelatase accessory protein